MKAKIQKYPDVICFGVKLLSDGYLVFSAYQYIKPYVPTKKQIVEWCNNFVEYLKTLYNNIKNNAVKEWKKIIIKIKKFIDRLYKMLLGFCKTIADGDVVGMIRNAINKIFEQMISNAKPKIPNFIINMNYIITTAMGFIIPMFKKEGLKYLLQVTAIMNHLLDVIFGGLNDIILSFSPTGVEFFDQDQLHEYVKALPSINNDRKYLNMIADHLREQCVDGERFLKLKIDDFNDLDIRRSILIAFMKFIPN